MAVKLSSSRARFSFDLADSSTGFAVVSFRAHEALSAPFSIELTLASKTCVSSLDEAVGMESLLTIVNSNPDSGGDRYFHGIIRKFEQRGRNGRFNLYEAEMVPSLWQLSLRKNSRIFQRMRTQEIVALILKEHDILSDRCRFALTNTDRMRRYCVQYRESDLDFITRLLEEEGIFYFFEHYHDRHVLVMGDDPIVHLPIPGESSITFNTNDGLVAEKEGFFSFRFSDEMHPGAYSHRNFNFKKPSLDLTSGKKTKKHAPFEVYDYPALHVLPDRGDQLAKVRLEALTCMGRQGNGDGSSCRLVPGCTFTLTGHGIRNLNRDYLITEVAHTGEQPQSLEEKGSGETSYRNSFTVIPADVPFRPRQTVEKPVVTGLQTAIVTGPPGEEIHTDRYGRVKVRFHWDREGITDDRSSCWVRCAQGWGGGGWGMQFLPRVGDEVFVDFIDGDPDRPIIRGSVYNEERLPLYELPANKTVTTLKTRSYPEGSWDNFNELRFEDKKGSEEVYLQGEKDWNILIKNDKGQFVGRDEVLRVVNNRTKKVGADQTVEIGSNHTETIGNEKSVTIGSNRTETVYLNHAETVGVAKELTIGGLYQVSVGAAMNHTVIGAKTEEVGLSKDVFVGAHMAEQAMGNRDITVGEDLDVEIDGSYSVKAGNIVIEAEDEIIFRTGKAMIAIRQGKIEVLAGNVTYRATGEVRVKGKRIVKSRFANDVPDEHPEKQLYSLKFDFSKMHGSGINYNIEHVSMPVKITKRDGTPLTTLYIDEYGITNRFYTETQEEIIAWAGSGTWAVIEEFELIPYKDKTEDEYEVAEDEEDV